jgi:hypothetical protein
LVQAWSTIVAAGDDLAELARCQAEPAMAAAFIPHDDGQPDLPSGGQAELPGGGQLDYLV